MKGQGFEILGAFKVPSLRNVAETAPYTHLGTTPTLRGVLEHYDRAPTPFMGHSDLVPLELSEDEFREQFPVARAGYVLLGDLSNATELFDDMLGADSLRDDRMALRENVLGGFDGGESAEAFAAYFHEMFAQFGANR